MSGRWMRLSVWFFFCVLSCAAALAAPAEVPQATSLLVDEAGALTADERTALLSRLIAFQDARRAQVAILLSHGTGDAPLAEYSLRVAESWKLGRAGRDDGLLILVVPSRAAVRLEVGYGLEGNIPDARVAQWLDELQPAIERKEIAAGLNRVLDRIDAVLPRPQARRDSEENFLFPDHPEWRLAFVLVVFSLFAVLPLFAGRWGSYAAAPLLAAFWGGAAISVWGRTPAACAVAAGAFVLPLLWRLNLAGTRALPGWVGHLRALGNLMAVLAFFSILTVFVGVALWTEAKAYVWAAPAFAGALALGLAVFLFPAYARPISMVLRSFMHFLFIVVVVYVSLAPFVADAGRVATIAAAAITALIATGLYLDSRQPPGAGMRAAHWFYGLALLLVLPFGVFALLLAAGSEDLQTQLVQGAAGGGSIGGALALAARYGLIAAVRVGLGGAFGGGGASRE